MPFNDLFHIFWLQNPLYLALSDEERVKEQIKFNTEILKLFAVALVATIGGIISLLLGKVDTGVEYVCLIGGMIFAPMFIGIINHLYSVTQKHIRNGRIL